MAVNSDQFVDLTADGKGIVVSFDELECSICLNVFNNAVATQCGHTFCYNCVHRLLSTSGAHVICPECRDPLPTEPMTRKRTTSTRNAVIAGGLVLSVNPCRRLNAVIGKLRIKCQHVWNGCNETIQLESMAAHHNNCEHRLCRACGLPAGVSADQHNCVELLVNDRKELVKHRNELNHRLEAVVKENKEMTEKLVQMSANSVKDRNEWKHKFEAVVKEKEEMSQKLAQLSANCVEKSLTFYETVGVKEIFVGKYRLKCLFIEFTVDGIALFNIEYDTNECSKDYIRLKYEKLQSLAICADSSLPLLVIRPVDTKARKIAESLSLNSDVFDVNSNDKSLNTITIVLNYEWVELLTKLVVDSCELKNSRCECVTIYETEGRALLDNRFDTYG